MSTSVTPRDDMDARIRARRARVLADAVKRRQRRTLSLFFLLLVVAVVAITLRSPLFEISAIEVRGVSGERGEVVRQAAAIQQGQHLLTAPLDKAQADVERLPWVKTAVVRRVPPSTIAVEVTPRRPLLTVQTAGTAWKVDDEAVVIDGGRVAGAPVIVAGEAERQTASGRRSAGEAERQRAGGRGSAGEGERQRAGGRGSAGEAERQTASGRGSAGEGEHQTADRPKLGAPVEDPMVRDAVRVHAGLPAWLRDQVTAYRIEGPLDLWLEVNVPTNGDEDGDGSNEAAGKGEGDGAGGRRASTSVEVRFGTSRDLALKAEVIRVLLPQAVEQEGDLDVRAPANPVVASPVTP